jgi:hypothetical protein
MPSKCQGIPDHLRTRWWSHLVYCTILINSTNTWLFEKFTQSQKIWKIEKKIKSRLRKKWLWCVTVELIEMVQYASYFSTYTGLWIYYTFSYQNQPQNVSQIESRLHSESIGPHMSMFGRPIFVLWQGEGV